MDGTNHYNTSCRKDVEKGKQQVFKVFKEEEILMINGNDMISRFRVRCPYYRCYFYKEYMGIFPGPS